MYIDTFIHKEKVLKNAFLLTYMENYAKIKTCFRSISKKQ